MKSRNTSEFHLSKKHVIFLFKALAAALVFSILVRRISLDEIQAALAAADKRFILMAMTLLPVNLFFQFRKWQLLVKFVKPDVAHREVLFSLLAGMSLGMVTPGRIGEFARSAFIRHASWQTLLGFIMIEKIFSIVTLYVFGFWGLSYFVHLKIAPPSLWLPLVLLGLALVAVVFMLLQPARVRRGFSHLLHRRTFHSGVEKMLVAFQSFSAPGARMLFLNCTGQVLVYMFQFVLLTNAFVHLSLLQGLAAASAIMTVKSWLPIALGDLGIRESAAVFFFGLLGVPAAAAFNASFLLFVINILVPGLIGFSLLLRARLPGGQFIPDASKQ